RLGVTARRNLTFLFVTLGWVFFRAADFGRAAAWFAGLAGAHGVGTVWTSDAGMLLALVLVCFAIVRVCPNSLELPLGYLRALPQAGLAVATVAALLLMNYRSPVLYLPLSRHAGPPRPPLFSCPPP